VFTPPETSACTRGDVLLTGATGFLGMELLARLLQGGDRRVWALVRAGCDAAANERMRAMLASLVPDPEAVLHRVIAVAADLTKPGLGLDACRRDQIACSVDEVIHSAASVSFSLPLEEARAINVHGTRRVLELAELCMAQGGLRRFAHVSTAYVEGQHRNTYEHSKWEAEAIVRNAMDRLPAQIFRPSIVVGHQLSGWTASFNVIYVPLKAYASGALRAVPGRRSAPVDVVPVSYVASAILALGDAGPGRTFPLVAGSEASTVGDLIDLAIGHLDGPPVRVLPPRLYERVVHPVFVRTAAPAERRWLERGRVFFPYFAADSGFDAGPSTRCLHERGIRLPRLDSYFGRLLDFAVATRWGRRPLGRAEALALAESGSVAPWGRAGTSSGSRTRPDGSRLSRARTAASVWSPRASSRARARA
jgi:nucleoside-diphosphate-sugar epimerase